MPDVGLAAVGVPASAAALPTRCRVEAEVRQSCCRIVVESVPRRCRICSGLPPRRCDPPAAAASGQWIMASGQRTADKNDDRICVRAVGKLHARLRRTSARSAALAPAARGTAAEWKFVVPRQRPSLSSVLASSLSVFTFPPASPAHRPFPAAAFSVRTGVICRCPRATGCPVRNSVSLRACP